MTLPSFTQTARKPNLLYILVDQLSGLALPMTDRNAHMPNTQKLAKSGVLFSHAYTAGMTCGPSRASLDTGLFTQTHGIGGGFRQLGDTVSLPGRLAEGGYVSSHPDGYSLEAERAEHEKWLIDRNLLPFASVLIEPAKVLFLNNAINHGVLEPLGLQQAAKSHQSLLFMIETDPGPGLGLLLAYYVAGPKRLRRGVPSVSAPDRRARRDNSKNSFGVRSRRWPPRVARCRIRSSSRSATRTASGCRVGPRRRSERTRASNSSIEKGLAR